MTPLTQPQLEAMTPNELEARRLSVRNEIIRLGGVDNDAVELPLLEELAYITRALRRRNAGPPAKTKPSRAKTSAPDASILEF